MPKYHVLVREVHVSTMKVEAEDGEAAIRAVAGGGGEELICEYSHTLDSDTWSVDDENGEEVLEQYREKLGE